MYCFDSSSKSASVFFAATICSWSVAGVLRMVIYLFSSVISLRSVRIFSLTVVYCSTISFFDSLTAVNIVARCSRMVSFGASIMSCDNLKFDENVPMRDWNVFVRMVSSLTASVQFSENSLRYSIVFCGSFSNGSFLNSARYRFASTNSCGYRVVK